MRDVEPLFSKKSYLYFFCCTFCYKICYKLRLDFKLIFLLFRSAHQVVMHPTQVLYFCGFCLFFSAPYAVSKIQPFLSACYRHYIIFGLSVLNVIGVIWKFTIAHPYLLADNRHYVFYIWKKIITRWSPIALSPIYLFGGYCVLHSLRRTDLAFKLAFPLCVIINLVPTYLLEFRYFVIPFFLYRLQVRPLSWWKLILEFVMFSVINIGTIYLFLFKSFRWSHDTENIQRFMW